MFAKLTGDMLDDNFHIRLLCAEVDRVRSSSSVRLAIALPPRSFKSIIVSIALPAWLPGRDPATEIVCVYVQVGRINRRDALVQLGPLCCPAHRQARILLCDIDGLPPQDIGARPASRAADLLMGVNGPNTSSTTRRVE